MGLMRFVDMPHAACQDVRLVFQRALEDVGLSLPPLDANHHDSPKAVEEDWLLVRIQGALNILAKKHITTVLQSLRFPAFKFRTSVVVGSTQFNKAYPTICRRTGSQSQRKTLQLKQQQQGVQSALLVPRIKFQHVVCFLDRV